MLLKFGLVWAISNLILFFLQNYEVLPPARRLVQMILQARAIWTNNKTANFDALHSSSHEVLQTLLILMAVF